jgi:hypothetical protein
MGVSTQDNVEVGDNFNIIRDTIIYNENWTFTVGGNVYLSDTGTPTQTEPTSGNIICVGFATAIHELYIHLHEPYTK